MDYINIIDMNSWIVKRAYWIKKVLVENVVLRRYLGNVNADTVLSFRLVGICNDVGNLDVPFNGVEDNRIKKLVIYLILLDYNLPIGVVVYEDGFKDVLRTVVNVSMYNYVVRCNGLRMRSIRI